MSSSNLSFGITLKADGSAFVGEVNISKASLEQLGVAGQQAGQKINAGAGVGADGLRRMSDESERLAGMIQRVGQYGAAYLGLSALADHGREVVQIADRYTGMEARLQLATKSQNEFNTANAELFAIAQRNYAPLAETFGLYTKLSPVLSELGGTQQQSLRITDLVAKSLRLSGAAASESSAAMLQFSQALGSGVLRGDEFNSLMENAPRLMRALADGMGKPIGALRDMATEGKLTAEIVVNALLSQNDKLTSEYEKMPLTVSASWTRLSNAVIQEIGRMNEASGGTNTLANSINGLTGHVGDLVTGLEHLAVVSAATVAVMSAPGIFNAGIAGFNAVREAALLYKAEGLVAVAEGIAGVTAAQTALKAEIAAMPAFVASANGQMVANVQRAALEAELAATNMSSALLTKFKGLSTFAKGGLIGGALWAAFEVADYLGIVDQISNGVSDRLQKIQDQIGKATLEDLYSRRQKVEAEQRGLIGGRDNVAYGKLAQELQVIENQINKLESRAGNQAQLQGTQAIRDYEKSFVEKYKSKSEKLKDALDEEDKGYKAALAAASRNFKSAQDFAKLDEEHRKVRDEINRKYSEKKTGAVAGMTTGLSGLESVQMDAVKAQLEATGMSASAAAAQVKVYEMAIRGSHEVEKLIAANKPAEAAAMRKKIDADVEAAQAAVNGRVALEAQIKAQNAAKASWKEAGDILFRINEQSKIAVEEQEFQNKLIGKSTVEIARLNAENRVRLQIEREIDALRQKYKDNPEAAQPAIDRILAGKDQAIKTAGDTAAKSALQKFATDQNNLADPGSQELTRYATEQEMLKQALEQKLITEEAYRQRSAILQQQHNSKMVQLGQQHSLTMTQFSNINGMQQFQIAAGWGEKILGYAAQHNKTAFELQKKLALAQAVVSLPSAVMQSYKNGGGYPWGLIPAGLMLLEGMAQINAINSASYGGSASTAPVGGGGGGFGSPSLPGQATNTSVPYLPQQNQSQSQSQTVNITVQVNAIDPRSVSDVDMQRIADSLSGPLQQSMNRGVNQNMVLA